MKNKAKKSKRVEIECISDLIDALAAVEEKLNEKLSYAKAPGEVRVEQGVGVVNVLSSGKVSFSMSVNDANAHAAYRPLKNALERAFNAIMPAVEEPSVLVDELPSGQSVDGYSDRFKEELEKLAGMANERLMERLGDVKDVVINFTYDGEDTIVRSGQTELIVLHGHSPAAVKKAKSIVWPKVDELKKSKGNITVNRKQDGGSVSFADRVSEVVSSANEKLKELGENPIEITSDSVGVYLTEGSIPICSVPKGVGDANVALEKVRASVNEFVRGVIGVVDRRKSNVQRANDLEAESSWSIAMIKKANPSIDGSDDWELAIKNGEVWKFGPNPDAASAIVDAAKRARNAFNSKLRFQFEKVEEAIGEGRKRMTVSGFMRGIVVSFGDDPCFISTFPLVGNNSTVEETVAYVESTVSAIGESRIQMYERVCAEMERKDKLREIAAKRDALEEELKAMAM